MRQICDDWAAICWYSAGPVITVSGRISAGDYVDILGNQVHAMVHMFPNNDAVSEDGSSPVHTTRIVDSWFADHEDALQHLPRPAQSPDILKPLWSVLESGVRSRFPPPPSLKQLKDVLNEVLCNIALETVHNLYQSMPRRIQAVLQANGDPTPY